MASMVVSMKVRFLPTTLALSHVQVLSKLRCSSECPDASLHLILELSTIQHRYSPSINTLTSTLMALWTRRSCGQQPVGSCGCSESIESFNPVGNQSLPPFV
jgi:hypothetical protein